MNSVNVIGKLIWDVKTSDVSFVGTDSVVLNNCISYRTTSKNEHYATIPITVWGARAEMLAKYFKKGDRIAITGELRSNKRKIGDEEYIFTYIHVDKIGFVESKPKDGNDACPADGEDIAS